MSSATRNPFALLNEDGDNEQPQQQQAKPAAQAAANASVKQTPKEITAKQTTSKKRDPTRPSAGEQRREGQQQSAGGARGGRNNGAGGRGPRNDNEAFSKDKSVGHDANVAKPIDGDAPTRGGRGGSRGGRGGRGREFDRRNATGKTDTPKATEQAWGNEAEAQQAAEGEQAAALGPKDPNAEEPAAAPVEEEDNTVSYEEYLKSKTSNVPAAPQPRAANEGAEDKWSNSTAFEKDNNEAYFTGTQKQKQQEKKERKQKEFVAIEQRFNAPPVAARPEGGRGGGRGGARGGRGRGEGRGRGAARGGASSRPQASAAPVMDESAFPELGKA